MEDNGNWDAVLLEIFLVGISGYNDNEYMHLLFLVRFQI